MGYGIIQKPGSDYGPCYRACNHLDCAKTRVDAHSICRLCDKPIGYETKYYWNSETDELEHALCVWEQEENNNG